MTVYMGPFRHLVAVRCGVAHGLASPLLPDPLVNGDFEDFYPATHLGESPRAWRSEARLNANAASITAGNLPGRYSGEMRRVVQTLLGRGATIPWSYSAATTHGLYTSGDVNVPTRNAGAAVTAGHEVIPYDWGNGWVYVATTTGTTGAGAADEIAWPTTAGATVVDGSVTWEALRPWTPKWLIQISSSGVHAYPLPIAGINTDAERILDYKPLSTPFPALSDPDVVELADAAAVAAPYALGALFAECGWAFSASGAKAGNVLWDTVGGYWHTSLYEITMGGETDGAPGTATVSAITSGTYYGPVSTVKLKYPDYTRGVVVSRPPDNGNTVEPGDSTAPVYCWYSGESRQDATVHWKPGTAVSGSTTDGEDWEGHEDRQTGHSSPVLAAPPLRSWITGTKATESDAGVVIGHQRTAQRLHEVAVRYRDMITYDTGKGLYVIDVLAIPLNEREAVYHARQTRDTDSGSQDRRVRWVSGNWFGDNPNTATTDNYIPPDDNAQKDRHPDFIDCSSGNWESVQCLAPAFDRVLAGLNRWSDSASNTVTIDVYDIVPVDGTLLYGINPIACGGGFLYEHYGSTPEAVFEALYPDTATFRKTGKVVDSTQFNVCPKDVWSLCYETSDDGGLTWNPEQCSGLERAWPLREGWMTNLRTLHRDDYGHGVISDVGSTTITREAGAELTGTAVALTLTDAQWTDFSRDNLEGSIGTQILNVVPDANAHAQSLYSTALDTAGWVTKAAAGDYPAGDSIEIHSAFTGKP